MLKLSTKNSTILFTLGTLGLSACTGNHDFRLKQVDNGFVAAIQRNHSDPFIAAQEKHTPLDPFTAAIEKSTSSDFIAARGEDKNLAPFSTTIGEDKSQAAPAARQRTQKVDLLWVVDNSASMEPSQEKLRKGFAKFAEKYMRPNWDIRVAAITTDTYLANRAYQDYISRPNPGYTQKSAYLKDLATKLSSAEPSVAALLAQFDVAQASFKESPSPKDIFPVLGPDYARLLPGIHDGPIPVLCYDGRYEHNGNPMTGAVHCKTRETLTQSGGRTQFKFTGNALCAHPDSSNGSITQCVNTALNNTVHSGKAIISTMPPAGTPADAAWSKQLLEDFIVNVSVSTSGSGSERGFSSVLQLLSDNENTESRFFRPESKRLIVFLSDENDGSVSLANPPANFEPETGIAPCVRRYEGKSFKYAKCPNEADLIPASDVKTQLDRFFLALDGSSGSSSAPNYAVQAIVVKDRRTLDRLYDGGGSNTQDMGTRYIELAKLVGNGSDTLDIGAVDYSPLLDRIGTTVAEGFRVFNLESAPTAGETLVVKIVRKGKSDLTLTPAQYKLEGKTLTILDDAVVNELQPTDQLVISYAAKRIDTFTLERAPAPGEKVNVQIRHADGRLETLTEAQYRISGTQLKITDAAVVKRLAPGDQLIVNYAATRETSFTLERAPESDEKVTVTILHADGTKEVLKDAQYEISGTKLRITDSSVTRRFVASDQVQVTYDLRRVNSFALVRAPEADEKVTVTLVRGDGAKQVLSASQYAISGLHLTIRDAALAKSLRAADRIEVAYDLHRVPAYGLKRAPESDETITVTVVRADGSSQVLRASQYAISGLHLTVTDRRLAETLHDTDQVVVRYDLRRLNEFALARTPNSKEEMIVKLIRGSGAATVLRADQYALRGKVLVITDQALADSLTATDEVYVNYQPKFVFESQK
jgi:hypothetical protein